jgi:ADP-ribose pyrophosphatase YjhB (NUDIX family)
MAVLHDWRICPRCGSALDLGDAPARVSCPICGFVAFANPKPTASAFVVDDAGRVLLARRAIEPFLGCWDTPGGFIEEGEHPLDALRRELREETSLEVAPGRFVGVWMDDYGSGPDAQSTLNLYWEATVVSGEPDPADDVAELAWFEPDALPPREEMAFTALADAIDGLLASRTSP